MRRYKALSRIFLLSYLELIFCGVLFGMMLVKWNVVLSIVCISLMGATWIEMIVAKHLFAKHYLAFFIMSIIGISLVNISFLGTFIIELTLTLNNQYAPYPWMILGFNFLFVPLIDIFFVLTIKKIHHKRLVEEGIIVEKAEDDI